MNKGKSIWPTKGQWYCDASGFQCLVAQHPGFWVVDFPLKYLSLRIDTRYDDFLLSDCDGNLISPDRVLEAIDLWLKVTEDKT